ncbi:hypothetical protein JOQ06_002002, partial [Pogonophryne albipinna]
MLQEWYDGGTVVRLDIFHWIHRFDAAVRTDSHSKYALAGAVLAYNRTDLELLIKAVRAKDPDTFRSVSEQDVVRLYVTRQQLQHHVRRVTLGAQETFRLIHLAIEELKGLAGLDQSGVSLFKTPGAIDEMWVGQQRHLECIQDPPGMIMYRVARTTTINGVDLPYYKTLHGSNSLEGFHKSLPHMIPGPHCAARPYQVYLISGIARWNCDRSSDAVFGGKGQRHRTYSAPLIHRLNNRCQQLFGETVEENFRAPAEVDSDELLGLEYLFSQSTERWESHCEGDNVQDAILPHITLVTDETSTVNPPAFEDACSQNPLPGFQQLERFCSLLVEMGLIDDKLSLVTEQRNTILAAWNAVEDPDKQQQKFNQLYRTHWVNTLYCRSKRHNLVDAAVMQCVKMGIRYTPAQQDISAMNNRLMYTLVKLLWLKSPQGSRTSPEKTTILKAYERIQHRVLVDDPVLSKAGFPLPKINIKTVRDFICAQECLLNLRATNQPAMLSKTTSVSSAHLPPAPHQPAVLPPPDYPLMQHVPTPSTAGTNNPAIAGPSTRPIVPAIAGRPILPATSTIARPVPSLFPGPILPASQPTPAIASRSSMPLLPAIQATPSADVSVPTTLECIPSSWARSTLDKRKGMDEPSRVGAKVSRVQKLPLCTCCGQPTQGHKKYRRKVFCP